MKVFTISETQRAIVAAGRNDEVDYQTLKMSKSLARDIEYALVLNSSSAAGASATARQLKGVLGWITSNVGSCLSNDCGVDGSDLQHELGCDLEEGGYPTVLWLERTRNSRSVVLRRTSGALKLKKRNW